MQTNSNLPFYPEQLAFLADLNPELLRQFAQRNEETQPRTPAPTRQFQSPNESELIPRHHAPSYQLPVSLAELDRKLTERENALASMAGHLLRTHAIDNTLYNAMYPNGAPRQTTAPQGAMRDIVGTASDRKQVLDHIDALAGRMGNLAIAQQRGLPTPQPSNPYLAAGYQPGHSTNYTPPEMHRAETNHRMSAWDQDYQPWNQGSPGRPQGHQGNTMNQNSPGRPQGHQGNTMKRNPSSPTLASIARSEGGIKLALHKTEERILAEQMVAAHDAHDRRAFPALNRGLAVDMTGGPRIFDPIYRYAPHEPDQAKADGTMKAWPDQGHRIIIPFPGMDDRIIISFPGMNALFSYYIVFPMPKPPRGWYPDGGGKLRTTKYSHSNKCDGWFCFRTFGTKLLCMYGANCYYRHGYFTPEEEEAFKQHMPEAYLTMTKNYFTPSPPTLQKTIVWPEKVEPGIDHSHLECNPRSPIGIKTQQSDQGSRTFQPLDTARPTTSKPNAAAAGGSREKGGAAKKEDATKSTTSSKASGKEGGVSLEEFFA